MTEDPGVPIMSPDELRARSQTIVLLTNSAPDELLALAGPDRKATLLSVDPPMITLPYQKGVFKVRPEDIVFENHHTGRDVTEAGAEETPYEKFFASAMKKFGVGSPIELSPEDTKKFFNYVDKNWDAEEETDEDSNEDVSTGKVGKKDKGSYQHAYKLALKKYKIHSADELDTPEERKGFTDYVDRLWKKGDIHRDKKETSIGTNIAEAPDDSDQEEREQAAKEREEAAEEREEAAREREHNQQEREQAAKERAATAGKKKKPGFFKKTVGKYVGKEASLDTDEAFGFGKKKKHVPPKPKKKPVPPKPKNKPVPPKPEKKKKGKFGLTKQTSLASKLKGTGVGKVTGAATSAISKYSAKEASIPEGVKKTPGVSKKARGAVGFAKHSRKGTGAKRQFQKGVRQAGKEQARNETGAKCRKQDSNEVLYQPPKSNKKTPETSWDKASEDKRAKLLQLASPRTSTKYTKLDYRELTPMLQKAIDKVFKTKKAKLEVSPPDRKHQVKGIKKHMAQKKGKDKIPKTYVDKKTGKRKETNPWALAWAQYDKYGVPSRDEKD